MSSLVSKQRHLAKDSWDTFFRISCLSVSNNTILTTKFKNNKYQSLHYLATFGDDKRWIKRYQNLGSKQPSTTRVEQQYIFTLMASNAIVEAKNNNYLVLLQWQLHFKRVIFIWNTLNNYVKQLKASWISKLNTGNKIGKIQYSHKHECKKIKK